ncbi:unnamed protein product [Clonostachys rosea]|uniref:Uncharacterized protein n=1 Tax=Bionectria ochroleuca TaxID=29856 RepID=A0ABY6UPB8_BIOOC|nr:unnamed protein product [Clonostachys rosea]
MSSEPDRLKYTGFRSMRELALEAVRNDTILRAIHLKESQEKMKKLKRMANALAQHKRAPKRPREIDDNPDLLYDADDEWEEETHHEELEKSEDEEHNEMNALKDGSSQVVPGADCVTEAESQRGSSKSTPGSENFRESEDQEIRDMGGRELPDLDSLNPNNSTSSGNEDEDIEGYEADNEEEE